MLTLFLGALFLTAQAADSVCPDGDIIATLVTDGEKCAGVTMKLRDVTARSLDDCATKAYIAALADPAFPPYFSWHEANNWCVYGEIVSSEENCITSTESETAVEGWAIYIAGCNVHDSTRTPCPSDKTVHSRRQCKKCKCNGVTRAHVSVTDPKTQSECAEAAYFQGYDYYSWYAAKKMCVYGSELSSEASCVTNRIEDTKWNWNIYAVDCEVEPVCVMTPHATTDGAAAKCEDAMRSTSIRNIKTVGACRSEAEENDYTRFSYNEFRKLCYLCDADEEVVEDGVADQDIHDGWAVYTIVCTPP